MQSREDITKNELQEVESDQESTVFFTGDYVEVITQNRTCKTINKIRKIGRNAYVNTETGEYYESIIKNVERIKERHMRRANNDLRRIIITNFCGSKQEVFITLTYQIPMFDYQNANQDFKSFWRRFKYKFDKCEYIRIIEPQNNGSWHFHVLVKQIGQGCLYITPEELFKIWKLGNVHVERISNSVNLANYFFADPTSNHPKAKEKGYRIHYYPTKFQLYSCSKGIIIPKRIRMSRSEIQKLVGNGEITYQKTNEIYKGVTLVNTVTYEQFKIKNVEKDNNQN